MSVQHSSHLHVSFGGQGRIYLAWEATRRDHFVGRRFANMDAIVLERAFGSHPTCRDVVCVFSLVVSSIAHSLIHSAHSCLACFTHVSLRNRAPIFLIIVSSIFSTCFFERIFLAKHRFLCLSHVSFVSCSSHLGVLRPTWTSRFHVSRSCHLSREAHAPLDARQDKAPFPRGNHGGTSLVS